uniref:Uncharacterized protein n=1 Tax=Zea mays TaxID=4577 RepID=A0A804PMH8_MAIZE
MEEEVINLQKCLQDKDEQLRSSTSSTKQGLLELSAPSVAEWWIQACALLPSDLCKDFDSLILLVSWTMWKERNSRVFGSQTVASTHL